MRRSDVQCARGAFSGCLALFRARKNEGKKLRKQNFTKNSENRKKDGKILEKSKSHQKQGRPTSGVCGAVGGLWESCVPQNKWQKRKTTSNSGLGFSGLKYLYPVISGIVDLLPANTKMMAIDMFVDGPSASLWVSVVQSESDSRRRTGKGRRRLWSGGAEEEVVRRGQLRKGW